ncbi:MAG: DEAD/DEAH box helicase [Planctomycetales bacterium]|nr:DEAD/DEAH box helicase [Planctomycetales bacterium]
MTSASNESPVLSVDDILGSNGRIARRLENYEPREQQLEMAAAVATALRDKKHLIAEAGTGTGKSFAYLVPAILQATANAGEKDAKPYRVVISTHTISLQEQLITKDIPLLNSVIPREFTAVLVKGRRNYLSLRRMRIAQERAKNMLQTDHDIDQLRDIIAWSKETVDGSLSDLAFKPNSTVWDEVGSDNTNCLGRNCDTYAKCFYYKARRRSQHAQILVVNHALFFSDLGLRQLGASILPNYDAVVLDEAHTIEDVASGHMGLRITSGQVDYILNKLYNDRTNKGLFVHEDMTDHQKLVDRCRYGAEEFFGDILQWMDSHGEGFNGRVRAKHIVENRLSSQLDQLATATRIAGNRIEGEDKRTEFISASDRLDVIASEVERWRAQSIDDSVYWIERTESRYGNPRVTLAASPIDVGMLLREQLFQQTKTVVLTSATLGTGKKESFKFFQDRIGLPQANTVRVGSPFDYQRQAKVVVVSGLPDPNAEKQSYERLCASMVEHFVKQTDGHAFALFTSYQTLRRVAARLAPALRAMNLGLLSQADGLPRGQLLDRFKQNPRSVLLGTDSFWQGVDVPGDALQNVIITKLPFVVPDQPLLQARMETIRKHGGSPFRDYQLPQAIIKFRQGFGRLIRTRSDSGIVVLLDPRVSSKPYGRDFLESLPECEIVRKSLGSIQ